MKLFKITYLTYKTIYASGNDFAEAEDKFNKWSKEVTGYSPLDIDKIELVSDRLIL